MGAFSCLCLPVAKRAPDVNGELELKSACERVAAQKTSSGSERCGSWPAAVDVVQQIIGCCETCEKFASWGVNFTTRGAPDNDGPRSTHLSLLDEHRHLSASSAGKVIHASALRGGFVLDRKLTRVAPCRTLTYADLCGPSKGSAVSPFEAALATRGASAPRLSFQGTTSRSPLLSPFDSVKSFPTFLSAASYPSSVEEDDAAPGKPSIRSSDVCPVNGVLGHFDLDRLDTARLHDLSSSQPPSPKTPLQGESFSKGSRLGDKSSSSSEALHSNNPVRGHPRYATHNS